MANGHDNQNKAALQTLEEQLQAMLHAQAAGRQSDVAQIEERQAMTAQASNMMNGFEEVIQEQLATIAGRLEQLSARLDAAQHMQAPQRPEEVPGYAELKTALHNLVEHLELAEGRTAEAIGLLHERVEELASRASAAPADLTHLEERIAALTQRLEDLRHNVEGAQEVRAYVDERMDALAQQVASVHDMARQVPQQVEQMLAAQPAAGVDAQITDMVARMQQKLERLAVSARQTEQLRQELDAVQQELARLRNQPVAVTDDAALQALRNDLQELSAQVAQKADHADLAALEDRLQALLADLPAVHDAGDPARLEGLEEKVEALHTLVEEALGQPLLAIEDKLKAHDAQLQALEDRIGRLDQLEQAIATLRESVAGGPAGDGEDIAALKAGMAELETFAKQSDARTREMLQAVQQTLAEVVERLIELEEGRAADAAPGTTNDHATPPETVAEATDAAHDLLAEAAPAASMADASAPVQAPDTKARPGIDPAEIAEVVSLLEKRADAASGKDAASARQEAEQDVQPGEATVAAPSAAPAQEDFIAAARRAALAATRSEQAERDKTAGLLAGLLGRGRAKRQQPKAAPSTAALAEKPGEEKTGRHLFAGLKARMRGAAENDDQMAGKGGSRKRLLLMGLVMLAAAALLVSRQQNATHAPAVNAVEQAAPASTASDEKAAEAPEKAAEKTSDSATDASADTQKTTPANEPAQQAQRTGLYTPGAEMPAPSMLATASIAPAQAAGTIQSDRTAPDARAELAERSEAESIPVPANITPASLRAAASKGDGKALYLIGVRYLKGVGLPRDARQAFHWFELAAQRDLTVAMYRLGTLYEKGIGTDKDPAKARAWYERAARRGNVRAMHNLGVLLASGQLGKPIMEQAAHWFREAARHGVRDSQFNLAVLYHRGQGVPRNLAEAWFWYSLAARQGDTAAARQAKELAAYLGDDRLAKHRQRLAAFQPEAPKRDANVVIIDNPAWRAALSRSRSPTSDAKPLAGVELVREVQKLLAQLGYDVGPVDGILGNRTANAIRLFQLQNRMPVNGRPDMALLKRLRALASSA